MKIFKLSALFVISILLLSGCGSKEEYKKGEALYEKGDEESLVKARNFFTIYLDKHPGDSGAEKWIKKIDEDYIIIGKKSVDKYFKEGNVLKAYEIMSNLKTIAPNDVEIQKGFSTVEGLYKEQIEFNEYSKYLEGVFKKNFEIYSEWDKITSDGILGLKSTQEIFNYSKTALSEISKLRIIVENEGLQLENSEFSLINDELFNYINRIESNLSLVAISSTAELTPIDIKDQVVSLKPENFNATYASIKNTMDNYVAATDGEGKLLRNITSTLTFKYDEIVEHQNEGQKSEFKVNSESNVEMTESEDEK
jgi:hypothetical protein